MKENQPETLKELAAVWREDITSLERLEPEQVAYNMVGRLAGNEHWDDWYKKNPVVSEIFDLVSDLELPKHVNVNSVGSEEDRPRVWVRVKKLVEEFGKEQA